MREAVNILRIGINTEICVNERAMNLVGAEYDYTLGRIV